MTSCFVYKAMRLSFHDRINTQFIYRFKLAQVVARRITKPQRFFRFESDWLLFFEFSFFYLFFLFIFFFFFFWGGGGDLTLLSSSCLIFLFIISRIFPNLQYLFVLLQMFYICVFYRLKG